MNNQFRRVFVFYFHFVGWDCLSLGGHICLSLPNIEIHIPFGFIRIGFVRDFIDLNPVFPERKRNFGIIEKSEKKHKH